jgi:hypothetical protein
MLASCCCWGGLDGRSWGQCLGIYLTWCSPSATPASSCCWCCCTRSATASYSDYRHVFVSDRLKVLLHRLPELIVCLYISGCPRRCARTSIIAEYILNFLFGSRRARVKDGLVSSTFYPYSFYGGCHCCHFVTSVTGVLEVSDVYVECRCSKCGVVVGYLDTTKDWDQVL